MPSILEVIFAYFYLIFILTYTAVVHAYNVLYEGFKGDISFAILDKAFYKCIENYRPTKLEVSQGAVADCLRFMNTF